MRAFAAAGVMLICLCGPTASAAITGTFTADNHYALYSVLQGDVNFVGRNELGHDGDPGVYNWSLPETFTFETENVVYIAAWSDDYFAQGLLGELFVGGEEGGGGGVISLKTGDPLWQVYRTGVTKDDGSPAPSAAEMATRIAFATTNNLWEVPAVGASNEPATYPWGQVPGISSEARWIWASRPGGSDPFVPGFDANEFLIFWAPIPSPAASAVLVAAGLFAALRRGRK